VPANQEAQQEAAKASDKLSCRTRLMGPLLVLGALVAQAKPAAAQAKPAAAVRQAALPDRNGKCPRGFPILNPLRRLCFQW
jgi:hypothetical protein